MHKAQTVASLFILSLLLFMPTYLLGQSNGLVQKVKMEDITVSARNNPMEMYRASAPRLWDIVHMKVALSFRLYDKEADGIATIQIHPNVGPMDSLVLDAKFMLIEQVKGNAATPAFNYAYANDALKIKFARQLQVKDTIELMVSYTTRSYAKNAAGKPPESDKRGIYFVNTEGRKGTHPGIWTQGESEENSHWMPVIDKPNERFTMQLELTVPDSFKTLSNGELKSSKSVGKQLRKDVWVMNQPVQTYAYAFAIGNYAVIKNKWRGKEVNYYVEPEYAPYASLIFNNTPEMLSYFSKVTGVDYPWNKYSQAVVRDFVSGAMENTTASIFGEFVYQNDREYADKNSEDVVAHELFHQWFGDLATAESWSNITVNESFANYGEQLWRRHFHGDASADQHAWEDLNIYLKQTDRNDAPLVRYFYVSHDDVFDRVSYNKGGGILHYLHSIIGDAAFSRAMKIYLTKNAYQSTEANHWRLAVEEATGLDWHWFFDQWYYRGGHPELNVKYVYNDAKQQLVVTVKQRSVPDSSYVYNLPLRTGILSNEEVTIVPWNITRRVQTYFYDYKNGQRPIVIPDFAHVLPGTIKEEGKDARQWLSQMKVVNSYNPKNAALNAALQAPNEEAALSIFTVGLNDPMKEIRIRSLSLLEAVNRQKWKAALTAQVQQIASADKENMARAKAFNILGNWKVKGQESIFISALDDRSYAVAGAALHALRNVDSVSALREAKRLLQTFPKSDLQQQIWATIAFSGDNREIGSFEKAAPDFYGRQKTSFAQWVYYYALTVKEDETYQRALNLLKKITQEENIPGYRTALTNNINSLLNIYQKKSLNANDKAMQQEGIIRSHMTKKVVEELLIAEQEEEIQRLLKQV